MELYKTIKNIVNEFAKKDTAKIVKVHRES